MKKYFWLSLLFLFAVTPAQAVNVDLDDNDSVDEAYGGTNTDTFAGAFTPALTSALGSDYDTEAEIKALMPITQTASVGNGGTLTPTAGYRVIDIALTCTADPSAITVGETGAIENAIIRVTNVGSNTCTFAYVASNFEHKGGTGTILTLETGDSFIAQFQTDRLRVLVNNSSTQYFNYLQVPTKTISPRVEDPDTAAMTSTNYNLFGQRFIATAAGTYAHSNVVEAGENWVIEAQSAAELVLTIHASDTLYYNGVACANGIDSDASVDAFVACQYQVTNTITCRGTSWNCTL